MKKPIVPKEKFAKYLYIALLSVIGILVFLLITGTIAGLIRPKNAAPLFIIGKQTATEQPQGDDIRVYSGLQRLRITLSDSSILVLSISFPYFANDTSFTEELAAKVNDFKIIANDYFSTLAPNASGKVIIDEDAAKLELLNRFNNSLRLSSIDILYFHDMMILDTAQLP